MGIGGDDIDDVTNVVLERNALDTSPGETINNLSRLLRRSDTGSYTKSLCTSS